MNLLLVGLILGVLAPEPDTEIRLPAVGGDVVAPLVPGPDKRATVALFVRTDCPISNRYVPEIQRIHETYAGKGVAFWLVYPDPDAKDEAIRAHIEEFGYPMGALRDPEHRLVDHVGAKITPEAALFDAAGKLVYLGRIDDRYVDFGKARPEPTRRDLSLALDAVLDGRPVERDRARAIGCFIGDLRDDAVAEKTEPPCRREVECLALAEENPGPDGMSVLRFACLDYLRSAKACDKLGWALFTCDWGGVDVYGDLDEARKILKRACVRGNKPACARVEGIPRNFDLEQKRIEIEEKNQRLHEVLKTGSE